MLGAVISGLVKVGAVAVVAVAANEVWQAVKPKVAEALTDFSLGFLDDSEDEEGSPADVRKAAETLADKSVWQKATETVAGQWGNRG